MILNPCLTGLISKITGFVFPAKVRDQRSAARLLLNRAPPAEILVLLDYWFLTRLSYIG